MYFKEAFKIVCYSYSVYIMDSDISMRPSFLWKTKMNHI